MNIIDIAIILIVLLCMVVGAKRGFSKELVSFLGFYAVVILAFLLRSPLAAFMYEHLPFIPFGGIFKGVAVLNIIIYEILAFIIILSVLLVVLNFLVFATSVFERLLNATIILGIPSKILGGIIGIVEGLVWSFIAVYIMSLPMFKIGEIKESKIAPVLLEHTPVLSSTTKGFQQAIDKVNDLKDSYEGKDDADKFNYEALDVLLEYKIVKVDSVRKLRSSGKLYFKDLDKLIKKYEEEKK